MSDQETEGVRSKRARIAVAIAGLIGVYLFAGYFIVPWIVESQVIRNVEEQTGVTPTLEEVRFDPMGWRLALIGFELPDPAGEEPIFTFEELSLDIRLSGFFNSDLALEELVLVGPRIVAEVDESGELNLARLFSSDGEADIEKIENTSRNSDEPTDALIVDIDQIRIERGDLFFRDRVQSPVFELRTTPLDLEINDFTTRAESSSSYSLRIHLGDSTELRWQGTVGVDPLRSEGRVDLAGLDLQLVWDYFSESLRFEVRSGVLDAAARYEMRFSDGLALSIREAGLGLENLEIIERTDGTEVAALPFVSVNGIELRVQGPTLDSLKVAEVDVEGGRIVTRLESDGRLHLVELFDSSRADGMSTEAVDVEDAVVSAPKIRIDRIRVSEFQIDFEDRTPLRSVPIRLSSMHLQIDGYENAPGTSIAVELEAGFNDTGIVKFQGPLRLDPLEATLSVTAEKVGLSDFQPYLQNVAKIEVPSGTLSSALELSIVEHEVEHEKDAMEISFRGRLQIDDLIARDRRNSRKFVEWGSVRLEGIDFSADRLSFAEIGIRGATVHVEFGSEGRSNLEAIFGTESSEKSAGDGIPKEIPLAIRIDRILLDDFGAQLTDYAVEPEFNLGISSLSGVIEGLSSEELTRARVDLEGRVDETAPIKIIGRINPLSRDVFTDLSISAVGIPMPAFASYSGRFVGYTVDRGELDLDLDYQLSARSLTAENHISLRQFSFGDRVESEDATSLPVPLAAALMRDSAGDIEFDLPIYGNLDDPSFSVFGLIGKALVNLVSKVATSPVALIGGLVGASGDVLATVVFEPGSNRISDAEADELGNLASALSERPRLRLEIRGRVDPGVDGPALREMRIEKEIQLAAFRSLSRRERKRLGGPSALVLDPADRLEELEKLYASRIGERSEDLRPTTSATLKSDAPGATDTRIRQVSEAVLLALASRIELDEADWRSLAGERALSVQDALIGSTEVEVEEDRVQLVDVEIGAVARDGAVPTEIHLTVE